MSAGETSASGSRRASVPWPLLAVLAAAGVSAWRFHRLRFYFEFIDESAELATGWLLTQGETLYRTVFSHHTPLAAAICQAIVFLAPAAGTGTFRAAPWAAYVAVAFALLFGPLGRTSRAGGAAAGCAFLGLVSLVGPRLGAHLVVNDGLWGAAFAVFFVLLPLPLLLGCPVRRADAAIAGAGAIAALAGSPVAVFPLAFALAAVALARGAAQGARGRALGDFAAGAGVALVVAFAWLLAFASLGGFFEEVFAFNAAVYARFAGTPRSPLLLIGAALRDWLAWILAFTRDLAAGDHDASLLPSCLVFLVLLILVVARARRSGVLAILALLVSILLLRMRGPSFHALPLYLTVAAAAPLLAFTLPRRRAALAAALALGLSFLPAALSASRHESFRFASDDPRIQSPELYDAAVYLRAHTAPEERIAAFSMTALVYLQARRRPVTDSVFFLPWQAAWERERPRGPDTCAQLRANPPRYVVLRPVNVLGRYPWEDYGACIDGFLAAHYRHVEEPSVSRIVLRRVP